MSSVIVLILLGPMVFDVDGNRHRDNVKAYTFLGMSECQIAAQVMNRAKEVNDAQCVEIKQ